VSLPLQGKTALVTGASRGIGRSIAERLAASGALVAINYAANADAAKETLKAIEAKGGRGFLLHQELGAPESAHALASTLKRELTERAGKAELDILVNNVGGSLYANIETTTPEIYNKLIALNVGSTFFTTQACLPLLCAGGRVVNISSAGSRLALHEIIVFCMSKSAVETFTRALAKELGPRGITVNAVLPGYTATDGASVALEKPEIIAYAKSNTALGRAFGTPEEVAEVVHALATPGMGWVTGQIIEVSGGFRM
jgi:NAD(P)-dependent dehydrogenase (short-subunit alcohol dehydrogenase family)